MKRKKKLQRWQTLCEVSLVYKPRILPTIRPKIRNSADVFHLVRNQWDDALINLREEAKVLLLNSDNRALGLTTVNTGGLSKLYIDPKWIFATAIKSMAASVVLCHNHPSGNPSPSKSDIRITENIKKMGELLEIELIDHLIITNETYYSFADAGIM
jgi:DNA repair protein RadC